MASKQALCSATARSLIFRPLSSYWDCDSSFCVARCSGQTSFAMPPPPPPPPPVGAASVRRLPPLGCGSETPAATESAGAAATRLLAQLPPPPPPPPWPAFCDDPFQAAGPNAGRHTTGFSLRGDEVAACLMSNSQQKKARVCAKADVSANPLVCTHCSADCANSCLAALQHRAAALLTHHPAPALSLPTRDWDETSDVAALQDASLACAGHWAPLSTQAVQALRQGHQEGVIGTSEGLHSAVFLARAAERARRGGSNGGGSADPNPDPNLLASLRSAPGGSASASERITGKRNQERGGGPNPNPNRSALSSVRVSSSGLARALPLYEAALALRPSVSCASQGTTASYQGEVAPKGTEEVSSEDRRSDQLRGSGAPDLGEADSDSALLVRDRLALTEQRAVMCSAVISTAAALLLLEASRTMLLSNLWGRTLDAVGADCCTAAKEAAGSVPKFFEQHAAVFSVCKRLDSGGAGRVHVTLTLTLIPTLTLNPSPNPNPVHVTLVASAAAVKVLQSATAASQGQQPQPQLQQLASLQEQQQMQRVQQQDLTLTLTLTLTLPLP